MTRSVKFVLQRLEVLHNQRPFAAVQNLANFGFKQRKAQFICLKTFDFFTGLIIAMCDTIIERNVYKIPKHLLWSYKKGNS